MSQCHAKAKSSGRQCGRSALDGASVCIMHGGSAGQVRAAAARRVALRNLIKDSDLDPEDRRDPGTIFLDSIQQLDHLARQARAEGKDNQADLLALVIKSTKSIIDSGIAVKMAERAERDLQTEVDVMTGVITSTIDDLLDHMRVVGTERDDLHRWALASAVSRLVGAPAVPAPVRAISGTVIIDGEVSMYGRV